MRKTKLTALLMAAMLGWAAGVKAAPPGLHWIVKAEYTVDKTQAERFYVEALHWMEDRLGLEGQVLRPAITVHVGEPCPQPEFSGACMNAALGVLYLPEWDEDSLEAVAQITLMTALHQLLNPREHVLLAQLWMPTRTA